jgi:hypothetical protein
MASPDSLVGLRDIDWASLTHAYGSAADVPGQLEAVATGSAPQREKAIWELWGNIHHQGTVYEASAYAVPFLARLAMDDAVPSAARTELIALVAAIAAGGSYLEVHEPLIRGGLAKDESQSKEQELKWVAEAHDAARAVAPELLALMPNATSTARWSLVDLAAQLPDSARSVENDVQRLATLTDEPRLRKAAELTLGLIRGSITFADLAATDAIASDLEGLTDPTMWKSASQGAQYIVTTLIENANHGA